MGINSKKRVKLAEMAALLSRSTRAFRDDVVTYNIPHIRLGSSKLFDPEQVEKYLESLQTTAAALKTSPSYPPVKRSVSTDGLLPKSEKELAQEKHFRKILGLR